MLHLLARELVLLGIHLLALRAGTAKQIEPLRGDRLKTLIVPLACALLLGYYAPSSQCRADFVTLLNNGNSSNRVDLVFVGDGYTAGEIATTYAGHVSSMITTLLGSASSPLSRYASYFNVHRVNVVSNESGADIPQMGITRDTALNATYRYDNQNDRLLYFNAGLANNAVSTALVGTGIDVDMRIGIVNESVYGGGGGQWAVYAGGNTQAPEIAVHELGHSFANLADEYFSSGNYTGTEPSAANVTTSPATGKWDRWLGYNDPNSNIGPIGYYQGGQYVENGIYRPSDNSIMRSLGRPFDAVGREAMIKAIYDEVNPLDAWLTESTILDQNGAAWVDVIDPSLIDVDWFIDGNLLTTANGEMLSIGALGLAVGDYTLTARAYDRLLDHSRTGSALDWWRLSPDALSQSVSWRLAITAVPEPSICGLWLVFGAVSFVRRRR